MFKVEGSLFTFVVNLWGFSLFQNATKVIIRFVVIIHSFVSTCNQEETPKNHNLMCHLECTYGFESILILEFNFVYGNKVQG
jgi:hypothetical protein